MSEAAYKELAEAAVNMRKRAEFNPATFENLGSKISAMFAESVELELALEEGELSDASFELADISLYVLSALGDLGESWALRSPRHEGSRFETPACLTQSVRHAIRDVFEYWRKQKNRDVIIALELVLKQCIQLSYILNINLIETIKAKIEINNARPIRHGGKNPNT